MDTGLLKTRIRRGRAWLAVNTLDHCQKTDKVYNPREFTLNLSNYEALVTELVFGGGIEEDCFKYKGDESLENGRLTEQEVEFILSYPELV